MEFEEKEPDHTTRRTRFEWDFEPVARQSKQWTIRVIETGGILMGRPCSKNVEWETHWKRWTKNPAVKNTW